MKKTILLPFLFLSFFTYAQQTDSLPPLDASFSALIVSDIDKSIEWYSKTFGFEVVNKIDLAGRGLKQANLTTATAQIELIELASSLSKEAIQKQFPDQDKMEGFFKFGFTVADFDKWVEHLSLSIPDAKESVVEDKTSNRKMLVIKDPDGNRIQLFEKEAPAPATKVTTFLMFEGKAEEAMNLYASLFDNAYIESIERYDENGPGGPDKAGTVYTATFVLEGTKYRFFDSPGPHEFTFTPSISLFVDCKTEEEQKRLYEALKVDGEVMMPLNNYGFSQQFAFVQDRFGVSWQLNLP